MARVLFNAEKTASLDFKGKNLHPSDLYLGERLTVLKQLGLITKDLSPQVEKNKHLGRAPRLRSVHAHGDSRQNPISSSKGALLKEAQKQKRRNGAKLTACARRAGQETIISGGVEKSTWIEYDHLSSKMMEPGAGVSLPLSKQILKPGGKFLQSERFKEHLKQDAIQTRNSTSAVAAGYGMTSHKWAPRELQHLQRLFDELGRPRQPLDREMCEDHVYKYVARHTSCFPHRPPSEVRSRVIDMLKFRKFSNDDVNARDGRGSNGTRTHLRPKLSHNRKRGGSSAEEQKGTDEGPSDYRSIGPQVLSNHRMRGGVSFNRDEGGASKRTIHEELARLEPTPTTYSPKHAAKFPRAPAYSISFRT